MGRDERRGVRVICSGIRILAAEFFMSQCLDQDLQVLGLVTGKENSDGMS